MRRQDVLLKKSEDARERHKKEHDSAMWACREYGSELEGDVWNATNKIEGEIKRLDVLLRMPEVGMNRDALTARLEDIAVDASRIQEEIDGFEKKKAELLEKKKSKE